MDDRFDDMGLPSGGTETVLEHNFDVDDGYPIAIPKSWMTQLPEFEHYTGVMWHTRRFDWDGDDDSAFLRFGAVNHTATVYLNGEEIVRHEGGFTPFTAEVTEHLRPEANLLVVKADADRDENDVPPPATDWFTFGGITRSVELIEVPASYIRNFKVETEVDDERVDVSVTAWIEGSSESSLVEVTIPALDVETTLERPGEGVHSGQVTIDRLAVDLWSPSDPRLYEFKLSFGSDEISDQIGLRTVAAEDGEILLNGEPVSLRRISLHEEVDGSGRTLDS